MINRHIVTAGAGLLLTTLATLPLTAQAELAPDARAHKACLDRFEAVNRNEGLGLRADQVYTAPETTGRRYTYFFNARARGSNSQRAYRVQCEARQVGRVTRFELEPGRWRFETPTSRVASR